jgi:hypothetical protein
MFQVSEWQTLKEQFITPFSSDRRDLVIRCSIQEGSVQRLMLVVLMLLLR